MANPEHVEIVLNGTKAIKNWRESNPGVRLDLSELRLSEVEYGRADQDEFRSEVVLAPNLSGLDLREAILFGANLKCVDLTGTNLGKSDLTYCSFDNAVLSQTEFAEATLCSTVFSDVNLSEGLHLDTVIHQGWSSIDINTLIQSRGQIANSFLRGCGVPTWMIGVVKACDPALTAEEVAELLTVEVFHKRCDGPLYIGGAFISYSRDDSKFVDKLYKQFQEVEASVWLDRHDMLPGGIDRQITRAIRMNDVVVLVLSESSLKSDWVWHEIRAAREKERDEKRDVLCPIAIDDAWEHPENYDDQVAYMLNDHVIEMDYVKKKHIEDFSKPRQFSEKFEKLLRGMKINYEVPKR